MPMLYPKPRPTLRRRLLGRLLGGGAVLLAATLWYYDSPLRPRAGANAPEAAHVQLQADPAHERRLTDLSVARRELPMVERSIYSLQRLKQRSPEQEARLHQLQQRRRDLHRLEDYELRLALHAQDSSVDHTILRQRIDQLSQALHLTPPATE